MKRYLVFAFNDYYPAGGWGDFCFMADTENQAKSQIKEDKRHFDNWHIVDLEGEAVARYEAEAAE